MNAKFFFPIFITLALAAAALADEEENKNCPFKACEQYITKGKFSKTILMSFLFYKIIDQLEFLLSVLEEALKKLMGEDEVQYCEDENLKTWSECFFEHIGVSKIIVSDQ